MERNRDTAVTRLYEREASRLIRRVSAVVVADQAVVEDACAFAWMTLARRKDVDTASDTTAAWLFVVAQREAWRIAREETATVVDATDVDVPALGAETEDTVAAREALDMLDQLTPQQRDVMRLFVAGYSYTEIAAALGVTYTYVNRHLSAGRKALRRMRDDA